DLVFRPRDRRIGDRNRDRRAVDPQTLRRDTGPCSDLVHVRQGIGQRTGLDLRLRQQQQQVGVAVEVDVHVVQLRSLPADRALTAARLLVRVLLRVVWSAVGLLPDPVRGFLPPVLVRYAVAAD